jgi:hypothetical protein
VRLWIEGDNAPSELAKLYRHLQQDPVARTLVSYQSGRPAEGMLGISDGVIIAAVSSGGALTALATSLKGFFDRPRPPGTEIHMAMERGDDRHRLDLTSARNMSMSDIGQVIERFMDGGD